MTISSNLTPEEKKNYFNYFYDKAGSEPGSLYINSSALPSHITLIEYNKSNASSKVNVKPQDCLSCIDNDLVSWADIQGLGSENILLEIGEVFQLHPLILEDVINVPQRPKMEDYKNQLLVVLHSIKLNKNRSGFLSEQISFVLSKNYLLTFQEDEINDFVTIRERIRLNQGKVRELGTDYLMYLLLDMLIDNYFPVLENYGERIEHLEDQIIVNPSRDTLQKIYRVRRELLALRRSIWPLRNLFNTLIREENELISEEVYVYLRDCYSHTIQILDILETYRELASSSMEFLISSMSNKMNEVITLLTIISSIFIPLTFIAGVYGMNFKYMPELEWHWGYFAVLTLMFLIGIVMIFYFWRRGWFKLFLKKKP
ncbi:magnesium/cobalt transporter CorA [Geminocystis sp. NIES-3709]|uniref:magnesium/cobalt transporter CorA n=1 Tax=Geminocystis sp. NIES-3709 TaxID=1617448 RepID=UPI0005FC948E|nr:magnesium/cobalt transporter CorA [Geminocystis sp. NIES-3709]BAQ64954.1 magnesium and cobalt transport protein CorA [Geminocystis sp. NIES-3709]